MGWTVVEPLSPGFFQLDPTAFGAESKTPHIFMAGASRGGRAVAKAIWKGMREAGERTVREAIEAVIQKDVGVKISDDFGADLTEQAIKNVDQKVFPSGKTGLELSTSSPANWRRAVTAETKKLARKQIDDLASSSKGGLKGVVGEGGEVTLQKGGAKVTKKGTIVAGEEVVEEVAPEVLEQTVKAAAENPKGLSPFAEGTLKFGTRIGLLGGGFWVLNNFLKPISETLGEGGGDIMNTYTGANCREDTEKNYPDTPEVWDEKTEECVSQAAYRTTMLGYGVLGVGGLLLFGILTYVLPKAANAPEEPEE